MKKRRIYLAFIVSAFLLLGVNVCVAAGSMPYPAAGEITSPFGWRTHPIFGTQRFHSGIDIGADYGDSVQAVAAGTVVTADWYGGYGKCVIIDHGNGLSTLYAHNSELLVIEGQKVALGTVISQVGSTGYSTGPHLHFEVQENGEPVNPMNYLDGSQTMPETTADNGLYFINSDYDETSWNFDSYFDFAKPLRDAINTFSGHCTTGIKLIQDDVKWLFFAWITIDLALAAMLKLFDPDGEEIFSWLIKRFLKYGFILYMIVHWGDLIANNVRDYFVFMGATAAGTDVATAGKLVSDPTYIVQKGAYLVGPVFAYAMGFHGMNALFSIALIVVALLLGLGILACFCIVGFQIMMAYLEFYVIAALSVVSMGFGGLKQTKFLGEKAIGALVQVSIKLMIFTFLAVFMSETIKDYETVAYEFVSYLKILLASITFVYLGSRVCDTAGKLLGGSGPRL